MQTDLFTSYALPLLGRQHERNSDFLLESFQCLCACHRLGVLDQVCRVHVRHARQQLRIVVRSRHGGRVIIVAIANVHALIGTVVLVGQQQQRRIPPLERRHRVVALARLQPDMQLHGQLGVLLNQLRHIFAGLLQLPIELLHLHFSTLPVRLSHNTARFEKLERALASVRSRHCHTPIHPRHSDRCLQM